VNVADSRPIDVASARQPPRRRAHGLARKQAWLHVALMVPATLLIVLLIAYPIVLMTDLSFHELKLFQIMKGGTSPFTWRNFERVLADGKTYTSLRVTVIYVIASTGISFLWGLATALLLNRPFRGQRLARIVIVSPWAVAAVVASLVWMFLLNGQSGAVNYLLVLAGAIDQPINFPGRYHTALATVIFVSAWKGYPFFTIMLLAGLQAVPRDSVDAARVDGAGPIRRFFGVTLPSLRPVIGVALPLNLLSNFREVETIMVLTGGGPSRATETLALAIYNQTFQYFDVGRAAALGVLVFLLSVVLVIASLRLLLPKEAAR
jgi:multiple sugar transport system permease protein